MTTCSPAYGHYTGQMFTEFYHEMNEQKIVHIKDKRAIALILKVCSDYCVDPNIIGYVAQEMLCTPQTVDQNDVITSRDWVEVSVTNQQKK